MTLVAVLVGALLLPCVFYAYASSPLAWGMIRDGTIRLRGGAYRVYREASQLRWVEGRAPWIVRLAAFTSFCLGQMLIPGVPGALLTILIALGTWMDRQPEPLLIGLAVAAPTGVIVAARLLGAGFGLLQRTSHAAERARSAAQWELCHNLVLFIFLLALFRYTGDESREVRGICVLIAAVNVLAMLHAGLLFTAASALDRYNAAAEAPEPITIPA